MTDQRTYRILFSTHASPSFLVMKRAFCISFVFSMLREGDPYPKIRDSSVLSDRIDINCV
jgi:hypothetical protein